MIFPQFSLHRGNPWAITSNIYSLVVPISVYPTVYIARYTFQCLQTNIVANTCNFAYKNVLHIIYHILHFSQYTGPIENTSSLETTTYLSLSHSNSAKQLHFSHDTVM